MSVIKSCVSWENTSFNFPGRSSARFIIVILGSMKLRFSFFSPHIRLGVIAGSAKLELYNHSSGSLTWSVVRRARRRAASSFAVMDNQKSRSHFFKCSSRTKIFFIYLFLKPVLSATINRGSDNDSPCKLNCPVPLTLDFHCGSNGITYLNLQELMCAKSRCFPGMSVISGAH